MSRVKNTIFLMSKLGDDPSSKYGHFRHVLLLLIHGHMDVCKEREGGWVSMVHTKLEICG